jgi:hypothetical protein
MSKVSFTSAADADPEQMTSAAATAADAWRMTTLGSWRASLRRAATCEPHGKAE